MRRALAALLLAALALPAAAWGPRGHQLSAEIAARLIAGSRAEQEVSALLAPLGTDLRGASVWADCVKAVWPEDGVFRYHDAGRHPECRAFEDAPGRSRAEAYVRSSWVACHPARGADACHKQAHYTDVAIQRGRHRPGDAGTSDHDLVAAMQAAIGVLQGRPAPAVLPLRDRTEALLLLVHLVGDVHQPLHVGAVYLDATGQPADPAQRPAADTAGGNRLLVGDTRLHALWDELPAGLGPRAVDGSWLLQARAVRATPGEPADWPQAWADDTLDTARALLGGLGYRPLPGTPARWQVSGDEPAQRAALQRRQLTLAGARLAQLLRALWP